MAVDKAGRQRLAFEIVYCVRLIRKPDANLCNAVAVNQHVADKGLRARSVIDLRVFQELFHGDSSVSLCLAKPGINFLLYSRFPSPRYCFFKMSALTRFRSYRVFTGPPSFFHFLLVNCSRSSCGLARLIRSAAIRTSSGEMGTIFGFLPCTSSIAFS